VQGDMPFIILLFFNILVVGAIYGLMWAIFLAILYWRNVLDEVKVMVGQKVAFYISSLFILIGLFLLWMFTEGLSKTIALLFLILAFIGVFFALFMRAVEKAAMIKSVSPKNLVEGDWIAKDVKFKGKVLCSAKCAGVSREQIDLLLRHKVKKVVIKEGIPFAPSFLIALIITLMIKNALISYVL